MLLLACRPLGNRHIFSLLSVHDGENQDTFMTCSLSLKRFVREGFSGIIIHHVMSAQGFVSVSRSFYSYYFVFYSCHLFLAGRFDDSGSLF